MQNNYIFLDLLRGTAAIAVCISHIRNYFFVDFRDILKPNYFDIVFYALTSLGHSAVIIFFVLSGYLIGGKVINLYQKNKYNAKKYVINRLVRLWVVLVPALILTFLIDTLGDSITGGSGYNGVWNYLVPSGPSMSNSSESLSFRTFIGNIFFLQTIIVPTFGSNTPLWSLSNEFWYYMLFPIIIGLFYYKKTILKVILLMLIILFFSYFPVEIIGGFIFWCIGSIASYLKPCNIFNKSLIVKIIISIIIFTLSLLSQLYLKNYIGDLLLSLGTGLLLFFLVNINFNNYLIKKFSKFTSSISYSLYLYHFPIVTFMWIIFMAPNQLQPNLYSYLIFLLILIVTIVLVVILWSMFEKNNKNITNFIYEKLKINNE